MPTIGEMFTDATLQDLNGDEHQLSNYNDKPILLHFWSVTCLICMKTARELKKLHEGYGDKLNIVSINMDTDKARWEQGAKRDNLDWANLSDGQGYFGGIGKEYGIVSYPAYVLIDKNEKIIDRWMGYKPGRFEEKMVAHFGGEAEN